MAKYTISYKCGHGSFEKQLYGKHTERERYMAWAEGTMLCPECYKAKMQAEDAAAEQVASVHTSSIEPVLIIKVAGKIDANKEALYALGFRWQRIDTGALAMLATKEPPKSLAVIKTIDSAEHGKTWLADMRAKLEPLGYRVEMGATSLDIAFMAPAVKARQEALAASPKPTRPAWYQSIWDGAPKDARWNGKIYGKRDSWRIYIADVEHKITDAQQAELRDYQSKLAAHRRAKEGR